MGKKIVALILAIIASAFLWHYLIGVPPYTTVKDYEAGIVQRGLENPTRAELNVFLRNDRTDMLQKSDRLREVLGLTEEETLNCQDYSRLLRLHAVKKGIDMDLALLSFENGLGHVMCSTVLKNGNRVVVEPQTDRVYGIMSPRDTITFLGRTKTITKITVYT